MRALLLFLLCGSVYAADRDIDWVQPSTCTPSETRECLPVTGYQVQRKTSTGTWGNLGAELAATARTAKLTGLSTGTHAIRVIAYYSTPTGREFVPSNELAIEIAAPTKVPPDKPVVTERRQ